MGIRGSKYIKEAFDSKKILEKLNPHDQERWEEAIKRAESRKEQK